MAGACEMCCITIRSTGAAGRAGFEVDVVLRGPVNAGVIGHV